jgi:hypothetical protein
MRDLLDEARALLEESRKIIRASSSWHISKSWDHRTMVFLEANAPGGGIDALRKQQGKIRAQALRDAADLFDRSERYAPVMRRTNIADALRRLADAAEGEGT